MPPPNSEPQQRGQNGFRTFYPADSVTLGSPVAPVGDCVRLRSGRHQNRSAVTVLVADPLLTYLRTPRTVVIAPHYCYPQDIPYSPHHLPFVAQ